MQTFEQLLEWTDRRRQNDARRFSEMDTDLCQMCHAYGSDKRSLFVACLYDVHEVVPEAIDLHECPVENLRDRGYYLRVCKSCRARFLGAMRAWRQACIDLRSTPKDHDGYIDDFDGDPERNIPYRVDGAVVMLTREEWEARQPTPTPETPE